MAVGLVACSDAGMEELEAGDNDSTSQDTEANNDLRARRRPRVRLDAGSAATTDAAHVHDHDAASSQDAGHIHDPGTSDAGHVHPVATYIPVGTEVNIPSNFSASPYITSGDMPASSASEPSGNFRFICGFSHLLYDDPIVYPGQPGKSHLHMFFGNKKANASSTYSTLRTTGDGSCQGGPLNRSAYWAPAVFNAQGKVVVPDFLAIYYKGTFGGTAGIKAIPSLPLGLRMIAGADLSASSPQTAADTHFNWYCENTQTKMQTTQNCPAGERLGVVLAFQQCWDGKHLDSPDHRSHLAHHIYNATTAKAECPSTHPVHLPEFTLGIWFANDGNSKAWRLSSDGAKPNGSTFHSDWFGAWDVPLMDKWRDKCINGLLNCQGGQLGDGTQLKGDGWLPDGSYGSYTGPKLLDPPKP